MHLFKVLAIALLLMAGALFAISVVISVYTAWLKHRLQNWRGQRYLKRMLEAYNLQAKYKP